MSLYLAVDAGGTKSDYVLADDTCELGRVRGGTIKRLRVDDQTAAQNLDASLTQLATLVGISLEAVDRICIGTAGEKVPLVADWLKQAFGQRTGGELVIVGDVEIALDAAFRGESGVLVLSGTGSNVAGRNDDGSLTTAGGWGPVLSDQGSGYQIGYQALRRLFLAIDEQETTQLLPTILEHLQLSSVAELVQHANGTPPLDPSQLTKLVVQCARDGDRIAMEVLTSQGRELGSLVCLVLSRLQRVRQETAQSAAQLPTRLAFAGSIMRHVPEVREALVQVVRRKFRNLTTLAGVVDPLDGALWHARLANRPVGASAARSS